jgi:hypothetical protein
MKGYAGRERPPEDRITVGAGHTTLMRAIEQMKLANAMGAHFKTKFLRVSPESYGVNFVTHDPDGKVKSLVEIGELPYAEIADKAFPVVYPADCIARIPMPLQGQFPVLLIVRFKDAVAWARLITPGGGAHFNMRAGSVQLDEKTETPGLVIEIPADDFKVVEQAE